MNQIKVGAILNYVIIALNTIVGLAYTPYMLRCLGQSEYGLYSLVASIIAYLTLLDMGLGNAIVRYTAKYRSQGRESEQWKMFGMFIVVYSIIGLIAFLGGLGLYFNVDVLFENTMSLSDLSQAKTMIILLVINLAITFPMSVFGSIITAYEDFVFQRLVNIFRIVLSTIVLVAVLKLGFRAVALVAVQSVFNILTLIINYVYCMRKLKIKIEFSRVDKGFVKEIGIYSFWIFLNAIMDKIYWGTGQFVLGALIGTVAVAVFSVAITLQQMYMLFSTSIISVMLPKMTAIVTRNNEDREISNLFVKTGRIQFLIIALVLTGFVVFGRGFVSVWAGPEYGESYVITLIFFFALLIPLIQNLGIIILQARNQMKFRSLLYLGISFASLIAQVVLSRVMGPLGCAIAIGCALLIGQGMIMNIYYSKRQNLDIAAFWSEICKMSPVPLLMMIGGLATWPYFNYSNPSTLFVGIAVYLVVYIPLLYLFGMNDYERGLIRQSFRAVALRLGSKK